VENPWQFDLNYSLAKVEEIAFELLSTDDNRCRKGEGVGALAWYKAGWDAEKWLSDIDNSTPILRELVATSYVCAAPLLFKAGKIAK